jgi:glycosyltransferase involved in cell wall biosynthesis
MTSAPVASVIIPAHNEEAVLARSLELLIKDSEPGELDLIVVANACADRTAEIAREAGVRIIETDVPGKVHAIGLGDAACLAFPRFYVDADVDLDLQSLRKVVMALQKSTALAAAPAPLIDTSDASRLMRRVLRVHEKLMEPRRALAGVGVYALTEEGHRRVFPMPDIVSDDEFVHRTFSPEERLVVTDATVTVRPARTLRTHLNRRVRVRRGLRQLKALGLPPSGGRLGLRSVVRLVVDRSVSLLDATTFVGVQVADRGMCVIKRRSSGWSTDSSSRGER